MRRLGQLAVALLALGAAGAAAQPAAMAPCRVDGTGCFSTAFSNITGIAASKLLGRGSASSGAAQEIAIGSGLSMTGTTLSASAGYPVYTKTSGLTGTVQFCEIITPDGAYAGEIEWVAVATDGTDYAVATGVYRWAVVVKAGVTSTGGSVVGTTLSTASSSSITVSLIQIGDPSNNRHTIGVTWSGWNPATKSFTWRMRSPLTLTVNPL